MSKSPGIDVDFQIGGPPGPLFGRGFTGYGGFTGPLNIPLPNIPAQEPAGSIHTPIIVVGSKVREGPTETVILS